VDIIMSHKRILLIAIAIGFVGGFAAVTAAHSGSSPAAGYSAAG
jgi:hypothetical protein